MSDEDLAKSDESLTKSLSAFDEALNKQASNPDVGVGPNGELLDLRLLPPGGSKLRNSRHKQNLLAHNGDELDAAVDADRKQKKLMQQDEQKFSWLKDEVKRKSFVDCCLLGMSNDELLRSFPSFAGSSVALSIAKKRCNISKDDSKKAKELRAIREMEKAKKDIGDGTPSAPSQQPAIIRLADGRLVHPDGTSASSGKLEVVQQKKRMSFLAAFRDTVTYEDACEFWRVLMKKALDDGEPWALQEFGNRMYGKPDKGILNHVVQSEIADQMDMSTLNATELRALADVAARLAGSSQSEVDQPDFVQEELTTLPGAGRHQLPPTT